MEAFGRFCGLLRLEDGSPFVLHQFQHEMLRDFFDGTTETLILIPKKNGKSTLLAALALYHLCTTPDAECVIAAASRDQASILFKQAVGFVNRSPGLQERLDPKGGYREIRRKADGGRLRVLASDANTADGVIPTLALVDELHRHKSADLYGVFRDGLGPRNGQLITISTAGEDELSPLGVMRSAALDLPGVKRKGAYTYARSKNGAYVMHEWGLAKGDDLQDMKLVKQANPAPWQTPALLKRRRDSPSMTSWQWARFACGVWTSEEHAWLPEGAWDDLAERGVEIPDGSRVWLGVDIGLKYDSSAVVVCWPRDDNKVVVGEVAVFTPPGNGEQLELQLVENHIRELSRRFEVAAVVYDPWKFDRSAQTLSDEGLLMVEFKMSNERTAPASAQLYEAIMAGDIVHDGDADLAAHVNAGVTKDTERGWRLVKGKAKRPIDALMALLIAFPQASRGGSAYERRGLVVL